MVDGRMEVYQKRMEAKVDTARSGIQGMMEAAINSIQSKLEETIKNMVENILAFVDQWTQDLSKELNVKTEDSQLGLQAMTMSFDVLTKSLCEEVVDKKKDLHKEFNIRIERTQVEIAPTLRELKTRLAEVKT
jgi:hypothetical protein